ncbi:hypothetical protein ACP4OV_025945 [Aristida adscensionis]
MASASAPTCISLREQLQEPFTFASSIPETYKDDLNFDYESWVEQSKISNHCSGQDDKLAEAIQRNHQEMLQRAVQSLPEDTYELSLRDLTDLSLHRAAAQEARTGSFRMSSSRPGKKPCPTKTQPMERASLITKLFMTSPSREALAGGGRKKSFSRSTVSARRKQSASINDSSMENAVSRMENETSNTPSNSMPSESPSNSMPSENEDRNDREINGLLSVLQFQEA